MISIFRFSNGDAGMALVSVCCAAHAAVRISAQPKDKILLNKKNRLLGSKPSS
jgi:hypothetical protein